MQNERQTNAAGLTGDFETAADTWLPERFHWLDFLRFLAALSVVLFHYHLFYLDGVSSILPEEEMIARFPHPVVAFFYAYGQFAVPFFWVLSGFVFAHVYFRRPADGTRFAAARFARLYPLHFVTLVMMLGLQLLSVRLTGSNQIGENNDAYHFILQLFLVSAWGFEEGRSFNTPIWSVSAEIAVYIIFWVLHRDRWFRSAAGQAACIVVAVTIAAAFPSFGAITTCSAFFFAGSLTYLLTAKRRPADFAVAAALGLAALANPSGALLWGAPLTLCILGFSAVIYAVAWLDIARVRGGQQLGALGDITYSMYLSHTPLMVAVLIFMNTAGIDDRPFLSNPLVPIAYVAAIIAVSIPCYRYFELPADGRLRAMAKSIRERRSVATQPVPTSSART